jgi:hypothetical protein
MFDFKVALSVGVFVLVCMELLSEPIFYRSRPYILHISNNEAEHETYRFPRQSTYFATLSIFVGITQREFLQHWGS